MNETAQLYSFIRDVTVPEYATFNPVLKKYVRRENVLPAAVSVVWPNGFPCYLVEMYLLDITPLLTLRRYGGSLRPKAASLSHLIKYCWKKRINVWDLSDPDFQDFIQLLLVETRLDKPTLQRRNRNTVRYIIEECIAFFSWLQTTVICDRTIVGPRESNPQIRLLFRKASGYFPRDDRKLVYPYSPPPDPTDPTGPMPTTIRNKLWDAFVSKADPAFYSGRHRSRFKTDAEFLAELSYLRARRELILLLLEATGARPGELVRLSVSKNLRCTESNRIVIRTLKRRRGRDPERSVPVGAEVAIKVELFIEKYRRSLLDRSMRRCASGVSDRLFLSTNGYPMSESTLTKDFQRIVALAQLKQRVCPSMFRHRFITIMVARHLTEFMVAATGRTASMITESDYRTILRKVATFTGHAREESLFRYIDWAWEEIGVFRDKNIVPGEFDGTNAFKSLIAELQLDPTITPKEVVDKAKKILIRLRNNSSHSRS